MADIDKFGDIWCMGDMGDMSDIGDTGDKGDMGFIIHLRVNTVATITTVIMFQKGWLHLRDENLQQFWMEGEGNIDGSISIFPIYWDPIQSNIY